MLRSWKRVVPLLKLLGFVGWVVLFCEFLIYYLVMFQCTWPGLKLAHPREKEETSASTLKVLFLSDPHLLGTVRGHWFDKLRREWQMERAFQTAMWYLQPEIVFILGDVFDEGKWSTSQAWADDVRRFQKMFRHSSNTELIVVVGNHDIGFHYEMDQYKLRRFEKVFNFSSAELVSRKGINFVLVNSVALEGDGCSICLAVEEKLHHLSYALNCSRQLDVKKPSRKCSKVNKTPSSAPILLQHFPLYRISDSECTGEDAAPSEEKNAIFKAKYDVLSHEASQKLIWWFHPRLILSGHTHNACEVIHDRNIPEISVPSFSWRNRNNPSFIMGSISLTDFALSKCFLPRENTVLVIYCTAVASLIFVQAPLQLFHQLLYFTHHLHQKLKPT
nr:PREDICTED: metallophosphoesterase 1 [Latimeria chalumnae]|eukprot:XP_014343965.1 PREDICTED: metallophosphoesterase 1 [Latimeria chalumnae]